MLRVRRAERLGELADDARAAQLRERVLRRPGGDDRTVGQLGSGPVVVGDDHLEAERAGLRDLVDGRDPAVDGEHEPAAVLGEPGERLGRDAVALLEPARQMPLDLGAERAKRQDGERGRADAVDVVVAVDADPRPRGDRGPDPLDRDRHVAEQQRVVRLALAGEEGARLLDVVEAAADQDRGDDGRDAETPAREPPSPPAGKARSSNGRRAWAAHARPRIGRRLNRPGEVRHAEPEDACAPHART